MRVRGEVLLVRAIQNLCTVRLVGAGQLFQSADREVREHVPHWTAVYAPEQGEGVPERVLRQL